MILTGYLKKSAIIEVFRSTKRIDFLLKKNSQQAEANESVSIGYDQTIFKPLTVSFMAEALQPQPGEKILDIGCGSG